MSKQDTEELPPSTDYEVVLDFIDHADMSDRENDYNTGEDYF